MSHTISPCENCQGECTNTWRGCPTWRKWFADWWNALVYVGPKPNIREAFQYEHPDRVREMAMQMGAKEDA